MTNLGRLDLRDAVECFAEDFSRFRIGPSTTTAEGLSVPGAEVEATIRGAIHPAPGEVLERLPEGQRTNETIVAYVDEKYDIRAAGNTTGARGDELEFEGVRYEVQEIHRWRWGRYLEVVAQRVRRSNP